MKTRRIIILCASLAVAGGAGLVWHHGHVLALAKKFALASAASQTPPSDAVGPFFVGVSSLDVEENQRAAKLFEELSQKISDEPAVWANLGLARLRLGDVIGSFQALGKAAELAPANDQIAILQALVDEHEGQFAAAVERLRRLPNPDSVVLYRLSDLLSRTGSETDRQAQLAALNRLHEQEPHNVVVSFSRARLLAKLENTSELAQVLPEIDPTRALASEPNASPAAAEQFAAVKSELDAKNFRGVATHLAFLQNLALPTPAYQSALANLGVTGGSVGQPIRVFLRYQKPLVVVSAPDTGLHFELGEIPSLHGAVATTLQPGVDVASVCEADLNGDFQLDRVEASASGLRIFWQEQGGRFRQFSPSAKEAAAFAQPCHAVWAIDFDADGDLDLLVARDGTSPQILRNNGDGSFTALDTFAAFPEIRAIAWGDFDNDGDDDLAMLDARGHLLISWNDRAGHFAAPVEITSTSAIAMTIGDTAHDGVMRIVALGNDGVVNSFEFDREKQSWAARELARWSDANADLPAEFAAHRTAVHVADVDNNGALDLVVSVGEASQVWLNDGAEKFTALPTTPALFVRELADVDGDGLLDLVGLNSTSIAVGRTRATKQYHWQSIQTRALANLADGRINSFGLGGRIEVRAGPLLADAPITGSSTHFGLGDQTGVGVARIVWPNGVAQVEFEPAADREITAVQRLKGSCPWVFARDGDSFHFVKDFLWRSPLGMRINSQDTAGVSQTEDRILIPGEVLKPDHGDYEIRITADLWETHFFDHIALEVVDHSADANVWIDERFVPTQKPSLAVIATTPPQPFADVRDDNGRDLRGAVAVIDGRYADTFALGQFQGIARDHVLEFALPENAFASGTDDLVIVGQGWIYPTDSSLNVAISQTSTAIPHGLSLEAFVEGQGWRTVSENLGFPAGKNKNVVIPFPKSALAAGSRRFRLRTNLEIYWDFLGWAEAVPTTAQKMTSAPLISAELRYRGFSDVGTAQRRAPDLPRYERIASTGARWRDLEGFYTRYGDVAELLRGVDDRYVIMNAGDEMVLRFTVPPAPPTGWKRDFVLVGDGWVKDGDLNTAHSRTVLPLPDHAREIKDDSSERLERDPVFQRHAEDWGNFHTRYVSPSLFDRGLMTSSAAPVRSL